MRLDAMTVAVAAVLVMAWSVVMVAVWIAVP